MKPGSACIVGAAETTELGRIPHMSQLQLHADAALNTLGDAGLTPADIDGVATAGESPTAVAHYLGITPTWVDGTAVGGCSFMLHVRHAAAAICEELCSTVLITHGESGRSRVGRGGFGRPAASFQGQFEAPFGTMGAPSTFTIPVLRYMKTYGVTEEQLAMVAVVQREWAGRNPRASHRDPIDVDDVLGSDMIAYPFRKLMCCLVTDGGGALVLTSAERARDFPQRPVYIIGTGESVVLHELRRGQNPLPRPNQPYRRAVELLLRGLGPVRAEDEREDLFVEGRTVVLLQRPLPALAVVRPTQAPARGPDVVPQPEARDVEVTVMPPGTASPAPPAAPSVAPSGHHRHDGRYDQSHEHHEVDDEHGDDPCLERTGEEGPGRLLDALQRRDAVAPDQLPVEEVDELSRLRDLQVSLVGLQEALEGGLHLVAGESCIGYHVAHRAPSP